VGSEMCIRDRSTMDYVNQLKKINHLDKDIIHAGRHLTVMYPVVVE